MASNMSVCPSNGVILSDSYSVFNGNLWRENSAFAPEFSGEDRRIDGFAIFLGTLWNLCRTYQAWGKLELPNYSLNGSFSKNIWLSVGCR